ncbi:ATP-dependent RNA helicase HrpA [Corynebacterium glyciniphilum]|uniref:ATP-dependent RNA helicase HrpA n=1 Tax=Corynebacterium glyciniphilum TaxID=1404244 RepID=UPI0026545C6E|nr:ATP-dependent RNA helicase HrpA [Corynebacterium glyciniphilum]MDN5682882.1 ATP-dependent RNA helicase HrpA [Corynebacterium glyciniphilum]MDN6705646.1 ATP-dependent RNA helicase HrpA [Corynebacterium glyciniphilum]
MVSDEDNAGGSRPKGRRRGRGRQRGSKSGHAPRRSPRLNLADNLSFPGSLPVSARRDEIMTAIRDNQVVIVAGETGSGKTTQLPKMCLELGRGADKRIGHTQPRRIAARSVADRIADELGEKAGEPGSRVGYKIRFDDQVNRSTAVKLMTDGILLAEIQRDRLLKAYDTIIVDEAHERSLNIDFLLGYLRELLPRRPDLKVIITSATIDPESFATHFADADGTPAPVIEVSGRTYPVEVRYRPLTRLVEDNRSGADTPAFREVETDPLEGLLDATRELIAEGPGDILCFFSGEREIRDAADALQDEKFRGVDVLPLFGRLSSAEQHRVFSPGSRRRIVLATNIAETSLTVPGIKYVIDTGYARISRYSHRTKVQRLPVEEISQASAKQRSGRCGRTSDGIAIRLYSEENFEARPEFTDPEILRTHLASVILSMAALDLGDIRKFPFLQPPDSKSVRDGVQLLQELGALDAADTSTSTPSLTDTGRDMARIPTDPRLAKMLSSAHDNGVLEQIAVIVAALSIQDVRERPVEHQARTDQLHARFSANSDFISVLKLWNYLQARRQELSGNKFRRLCRDEFIHYVRVLEWMDLVRQLFTVIQELRWSIPNVRHFRELTFDLGEDEGSPVSPDETGIHKSLLAGLVTNVGMRQGNSRQFTGTRNTSFVIHPSSHLAKKPPQWVMAAELVETSQVFARTVAPVVPEWIEEIAPQLMRYSYAEPFWSSKQGAALAVEKASMLGLPVISDRRVNLSKTDPEGARDMFIRNALVEGEWRTNHRFFRHNRELLDEAGQLEDKARRRDIVVDDETIYSFYDERLPASIVSARHFDSWWKKARQKNPHLLEMTPEALIGSDGGAAQAREFPDTWRQGSMEFDLTYVFRPGDPADGITMRIPLPLLAGVTDRDTKWLVSGMREELCVALIRTLPKPLRTSVVPAAQFARAALDRMTPYDGPVDQALADALRSLGGTGIGATDFDWNRVPAHLRMTYAAVDRRGKVIAASKDLGELQERLSGEITQSIASATARSSQGHDPSSPSPRDSAAHQHSGKRKKDQRGSAGGGGILARSEDWTAEGIGTIPESVETVVDGQTTSAYPALVAAAPGGRDGVVLKAFPTLQAAAGQQFSTVLEMMVDACQVSTRQTVKGLPLRQRVAVDTYPHGGPEALVDDCRVLACRELLNRFGTVIRDPERCAEAVTAAREKGPGLVRQIFVAVSPAVLAVSDMSQELEGWDGAAIDEMRGQLDFYLGPHRVAKNGVENLRHVPRYVAAMKSRLSMMESDPDREAALDDQVRECTEAIAETRKRLPAARSASPQFKDVEWLVEEFRVSLFAQNLGTSRPASAARVKKALAKIR